MKNNLLILLALVALTISSCKKEKVTDDVETPNLYVTFDFDGTAKSYTGTNYVMTTSAGSYSAGGFDDAQKAIEIGVHIEQATLKGADLEALIGQKLDLQGCTAPGCGLIANIEFREGAGFDYAAYSSNNTLPGNYMQIDSVTFLKNVDESGKQVGRYVVVGKFEANLTAGSDTKPATNGKFKLVFSEEF